MAHLIQIEGTDQNFLVSGDSEKEVAMGYAQFYNADQIYHQFSEGIPPWWYGEFDTLEEFLASLAKEATDEAAAAEPAEPDYGAHGGFGDGGYAGSGSGSGVDTYDYTQATALLAWEAEQNGEELEGEEGEGGIRGFITKIKEGALKAGEQLIGSLDTILNKATGGLIDLNTGKINEAIFGKFGKELEEGVEGVESFEQNITGKYGLGDTSSTAKRDRRLSDAVLAAYSEEDQPVMQQLADQVMLEQAHKPGDGVLPFLFKTAIGLAFPAYGAYNLVQSIRGKSDSIFDVAKGLRRQGEIGAAIKSFDSRANDNWNGLDFRGSPANYSASAMSSPGVPTFTQRDGTSGARDNSGLFGDFGNTLSGGTGNVSFPDITPGYTSGEGNAADNNNTVGDGTEVDNRNTDTRVDGGTNMGR